MSDAHQPACLRELYYWVVCAMAKLTGVVRDDSRLFWWRLGDEG